jgi:hypothetical protein
VAGAYEKEIEIILKEANNIINRQKDAIEKQKEGGNMK